MGAILVMYHYVRDPDPRHPGIAAITLDDFEGQVEHLLRHYEPLEPDALLAAVRDGSPIPDGFVLTFDDGVRDHYDNAAPVLERHGIHGIFAPIGLPYLHGRIPFVQKNQFVRGRLGEDGVADAYVAAAEEVAPEADVPGIMSSAPIGDYRRGSEKYLRFKYASNRLIPREVSERIMDRLFARARLGGRGRVHPRAVHVDGRDRRAAPPRPLDRRPLDLPPVAAAARRGRAGARDRRGRRLARRAARTSRSPGSTTRTATTTSARSASASGSASRSPTRRARRPTGSAHDERFRVPRVDTCFLPVTRRRRAGRAGRRGRLDGDADRRPEAERERRRGGRRRAQPTGTSSLARRSSRSRRARRCRRSRPRRPASSSGTPRVGDRVAVLSDARLAVRDRGGARRRGPPTA